MRPVIVHISADYPDVLEPAKTSAIRSLIDGTADTFRHVVYSLNRVDGWSGIAALPFGEDRIAIAYRALPKGILWESRLDSLAVWIEADLRAKGIRPDAVEAHKFTVEGLIGQNLARAFGVPLICDIQGDTDTKILGVKKSLRKRYQAIAGQAALVFPYAPWPIKAFADTIGLAPAKCRVLPVVPLADALSPAPTTAQPRFVSVFNLDSWRRKNIVGLASAIRLLAEEYPAIGVDVYGRGNAKALLEVRAALSKAGADGYVRFMGAAPNGELPRLLKAYTALAVPSVRETYGLVYAEALFAGLPVLFGRNRAIDGIFSTEAIGASCDPSNTADIARALGQLVLREKTLKDGIARMQVAGELDRIRREVILRTYRDELIRILKTGAAPA